MATHRTSATIGLLLALTPPSKPRLTSTKPAVWYNPGFCESTNYDKDSVLNWVPVLDDSLNIDMYKDEDLKHVDVPYNNRYDLGYDLAQDLAEPVVVQGSPPLKNGRKVEGATHWTEPELHLLAQRNPDGSRP